MAWFAICLPLMAVRVAIATVPLVFATHHQQRYGHHGSGPHRQGEPGSVPTRPATGDSHWTVRPGCTAVVTDAAIHRSVVHATAMG